MTAPQGKAVSVSISDIPETKHTYRAQYMAMVMEDGSVWSRDRSVSSGWKWCEWELTYSPLKAQETA